MFILTMRRVASAVASSALIVGGLVAGSSGTAGASNPPGDVCTSKSKSVENIDVIVCVDVPGRDGPLGPYAEPGGVVHVRASIFVDGDPASVPRRVTRITQHVPVGFELVPGSATLDAPGGLYEPLPVTPVVSADGASITAVAEADGWLVARNAGGVELNATYRVPRPSVPGSTVDFGVTFEASGLDGTQGWPEMGALLPVGAPNPLASSADLSDLSFGS